MFSLVPTMSSRDTTWHVARGELGETDDVDMLMIIQWIYDLGIPNSQIYIPNMILIRSYNPLCSNSAEVDQTAIDAHPLANFIPVVSVISSMASMDCTFHGNCT